MCWNYLALGAAGCDCRFYIILFITLHTYIIYTLIFILCMCNRLLRFHTFNIYRRIIHFVILSYLSYLIILLCYFRLQFHQFSLMQTYVYIADIVWSLTAVSLHFGTFPTFLTYLLSADDANRILTLLSNLLQLLVMTAASNVLNI